MKLGTAVFASAVVASMTVLIVTGHGSACFGVAVGIFFLVVLLA